MHHTLSRVLSGSVLAILAVMLPACSGTRTASINTHPGVVVPSATPAQDAALIGRIKALAGTWERIDDKGQRSTSSIYTVTSNGSVVRQIMLPGTSHEMTNMYHMDGPSMVMVHYCAMGNQPHMRATAADSSADRIVLHSDGVTNRTAADQTYMAELTIIFTDANTIREEWRSFEHGKIGAPTTFDLRRKL